MKDFVGDIKAELIKRSENTMELKIMVTPNNFLEFVDLNFKLLPTGSELDIEVENDEEEE
jgi:hypothetical protein